MSLQKNSIGVFSPTQQSMSKKYISKDKNKMLSS